NKIIITTDSAADIPHDLIEKYNIKIMPLYIKTKSHTYRDTIDIQPDDMFSYYEKTKNTARTHAVSISEYLEFFMPIVGSGHQIIHINISSELSACYQNACTAAKELPKGSIYIIDSLNVSSGMALCVIKACKLVEEGKTTEYIATTLNNDLVPRVEASFMLDTLNYYHASDRCPSIHKNLSNLFNIHVCIYFKRGRSLIWKKYKGPLAKCVSKYVNKKLKNHNDIDKSMIFIAHSRCDQNIIENIKDKLKNEYNFKQVIEAKTNCTISSYCGPNTIGIMFLRNK
ncbi:MAG: DegV family protein, partial [Oscillospiraceae bacterium]|nr:DegV family protein [Oscillospiraceae bacterium]